MNLLFRTLTRRPLALWGAVLLLFAIGTYLRLTSIDRGTPTIGVAVYVLILVLFFTMIAVPIGMTAGIAARWLVRWSIAPTRVRAVAALIAAFAVFAFHNLGRTLPPWHVWAIAAAITALLTLSTYRWGRLFVIAWRADRAALAHARLQEISGTRSAFDLRNF
ncbi:MAG: hypothetical protein ACRDAM_22565 [Casimicrobium sp.]